MVDYNISNKDVVAKKRLFQQGRFFLHNLTTQNHDTMSTMSNSVISI